MPLDLTEYKVLSFDIYGTLINWETGIFEELLERLGGATNVERTMGATSAESLRNGLLSMYAGEEKRLQKEFPGMGYQSLLSEIYLLIGERLEIVVEQDKALSFGASIPQWPAFTDTVAAMKKLAKYYKLVVLSNVDEESFRATLRVPLEGVKFDAVYTAEEIGSYKPAPENFEYLIEHVKKDFLVPKDQILHVANSLTHDHIPAKKIGMRPGVWIERRGERCCLTGNVNSILKSGKVEFGARFKNLRELAEAVEKAFEEKKERDANPGAGTYNWL